MEPSTIWLSQAIAGSRDISLARVPKILDLADCLIVAAAVDRHSNQVAIQRTPLQDLLEDPHPISKKDLFDLLIIESAPD